MNCLKCFVGFALMLALLAAALFGYVCLRVDRQGATDQARQADAIVVLGARVLPDGRPSEDLLVRTLHAADLFRQGIAPVLVCTGGYAGDRMSAASVARRIALASALPEEAILIADGSMTTQEDAIVAARVLRERGLSSAILVSHPLHLFRAKLLFERQGVTVYTSPTNTDLSALPTSWRLGLDAREAVFLLWTGVEQWGLPRAWGRSAQRGLYQLLGVSAQ